MLDTINYWAARNGVPRSAIAELAAMLAPVTTNMLTIAQEPYSEALVQSQVRLEAAACGVWLTRNNVGVLPDTNGRPVRYGLANESKAQNQVVKSGDLIGFRKRVIVPTDVGSIIAQFVSRECKRSDWRPRDNDKHEAAQRRWAAFINANGGDAAIVSAPGSFA